MATSLSTDMINSSIDLGLDDDEDDFIPESLRGFLEAADKQLQEDLADVLNFDSPSKADQHVEDDIPPLQQEDEKYESTKAALGSQTLNQTPSEDEMDVDTNENLAAELSSVQIAASTNVPDSPAPPQELVATKPEPNTEAKAPTPEPVLSRPNDAKRDDSVEKHEQTRQSTIATQSEAGQPATEEAATAYASKGDSSTSPLRQPESSEVSPPKPVSTSRTTQSSTASSSQTKPASPPSKGSAEAKSNRTKRTPTTTVPKTSKTTDSNGNNAQTAEKKQKTETQQTRPKLASPKATKKNSLASQERPQAPAPVQKSIPPPTGGESLAVPKPTHSKPLKSSPPPKTGQDHAAPANEQAGTHQSVRKPQAKAADTLSPRGASSAEVKPKTQDTNAGASKNKPRAPPKQDTPVISQQTPKEAPEKTEPQGTSKDALPDDSGSRKGSSIWGNLTSRLLQSTSSSRARMNEPTDPSPTAQPSSKTNPNHAKAGDCKQPTTTKSSPRSRPAPSKAPNTTTRTEPKDATAQKRQTPSKPLASTVVPNDPNSATVKTPSKPSTPTALPDRELSPPSSPAVAQATMPLESLNPSTLDPKQVDRQIASKQQESDSEARQSPPSSKTAKTLQTEPKTIGRFALVTPPAKQSDVSTRRFLSAERQEPDTFGSKLSQLSRAATRVFNRDHTSVLAQPKSIVTPRIGTKRTTTPKQLANSLLNTTVALGYSSARKPKAPSPTKRRKVSSRPDPLRFLRPTAASEARVKSPKRLAGQGSQVHGSNSRSKTPLKGGSSPSKRTLTTPEPFKFLTDQRVKDHKPVVSPPKVHRGFTFKARPLPNFGRPRAGDGQARVATKSTASSNDGEVHHFRARPLPHFMVPTAAKAQRDHVGHAVPEGEARDERPAEAVGFRARKMPNMSQPSISVKDRNQIHVRMMRAVKHAVAANNMEESPTMFKARPAPKKSLTTPSIPVRERHHIEVRKPTEDSKPASNVPCASIEHPHQFHARRAPKPSDPSIPVKMRGPSKLR